MRIRSVAASLMVGLGLAIAVLWLMDGHPAAVVAAPVSELRVCLSGCPYASVQAAVDAASDGDVIKIAAGTYTGVSSREGVTQVVYISKSVTIQGGYTTANWTTPDPEANVTTLDAQGQGRVLYVIGGNGAVIDGLRITGGNAFGELGGHLPSSPEGAGGGVYVHGARDPFGAEFTLTNNAIFGNTARQGGGVYMSFCCEIATLRGNTFTSNSAESDGGGVLLHAGVAALTDNVFDSNSADRGGGLYADHNGTPVLRNTFVSNTAQTAGGGLYLNMDMSDVNINATTIVSNTAGRGGGLAITGGDAEWGRSATLINAVIADNQASVEGGGMYIVSAYSVHLWHTTLARNGDGDGSGVHIGGLALDRPGPSTVALTNTILSSQDVGIRVADSSTVTVNSILWHSTPITVSQSLSATVVVQNQHTGDPAFLDPDGGDYHIGTASAARDAGVDGGVPNDLDGQIRPMGLGWDIGADEYPAPALSVSNEPSAAYVNRGQQMAYTLGVTNIGAGSAAATGVVLTDTLDSRQRATGAVASAGSCAISDPAWGGAIVCSVGALSTGASVTITLTVEVTGTVPLGQAMVNTAVVRANEARGSTAQAITYAQDCHVRINASPTAYASVQAAVDAASPGDVVKVAGTCMGVGDRAGLRQQVYLDKGLTVRGGYTLTNWTTPDPEVNPTTLDALGEGRVFYVTGAISPTIEGLRITGGDAAGLGGVPWGWDAGAGMYVVSATVTISNNWINGNTAGVDTSLGGGIYLQSSDSAVFSNTISSNTAGWGGGIQTLYSSATLSHNTILSNTARGGGGIALWGLFEGDTVVCMSNTVRGNIAHEIGGGMSVGVPGSTLVNNIVTDNSAGVSGSGLYIDGSAQFWHTTVARNTGGDGSGIFVTSDAGPISVAFTNTILAQHSVGISVTAGNTVTVNGILWNATPITVPQSLAATVEIQNQVTGEPAFVDPGNGDYHISATSAAIDRGVTAGTLTDIDGDVRPQGRGFDLGADEFLVPTKLTYLPLVLR